MIRVTRAKGRTVGVLAAAGLAAVMLPAGPAAAACSVAGVSPNDVVVGLSPVTRTYSVDVTTEGTCTSATWTLSAPAANLTVTSAAPEGTINPMGLSNADAGTSSSTVTVTGNDGSTVTDPGPFTVRRNTTWSAGTFNAYPEPVRNGGTLTLRGKLKVADWQEGAYVNFANRSVRVDFKARGTSTYVYVKTAVTSSGGWISTTARERGDGYWRLRYSPGTTEFDTAITSGDYVDVR